MIKSLGGRKFVLAYTVVIGLFGLIAFVPEVRELAMKLLAVIVGEYIIGNVANKTITE